MANKELRVVGGKESGSGAERPGPAQPTSKLPLSVRIKHPPSRASARVPAEYRNLCVDAVEFFRDLATMSNGYEKQIVETGGTHDIALAEAVSAFETTFLPRWFGLQARSYPLAAPMMSDPKLRQAAKDFTESLVTPEVMAGPIWKQGYEKPLGYPGDFKVMNYLYEEELPGDSIYGKLVHKLGQDISTFVNARMEMVRQAIATTVEENRGRDGSVKIVSIGCGPAREVTEYLAWENDPVPVEFTLVDYDQNALDAAVESAAPYIGDSNSDVKIDTTLLSVVDFLKQPDLLADIGEQQLVYSVGLFDYFGQKTCKRLMPRLFDRVAPGGMLLIGNMKAGTDILWPLEFVGDWSLNYRTADEMLDLGVLPGAESVDLHMEGTGKDYLLFIRKKE
ncbi:MAG: hypothetical protein OQJ87_12805 [Rhodospirillales bacterium]|nr:hypothetical protein [Rhodospirillales bacterium]MCW8952312.1 hypothetical protein [Rhodospirillales bacterium]MCW8970477.1 hypothetical protein [Rhodospirillales bacterium]MCW9003582.1 hypothetical protein [Rhodospirillales bacterium]